MNKILTNLINKKYYETTEIAQNKVDVCFAMNRITEDEYNTLTSLITTIYGK